MQIMKVSNYLKSISSTCGGSIRRNQVAWILFLIFLLMDWKTALICYTIPVILLWLIWRGKNRELALTPIVNLYALYEIIWEWIYGKIKN